MRIDPNQAAQPALESGRSASQSVATTESRTSGVNPLGEDQTQLSGAHAQVQTLAAQAAQLPEIRQEKVNALRQVVAGGSYQPSSQTVAEALFAHMVVEAA
jgi:flagellar biosynthesis anti-sigma factor FlgM